MQIRKAKKEEAKTIIDLHQNTVRKINSRDYSSKQIEMWLGKRKIEITEKMIANREYYVAINAHNDILGTGHMKENKITGLYVSADCQRKGVGSAILVQMEKDALSNGAEKMEIESTLTAASFYQQMRYKIIKSKKIGRAKLDVIIMQKELNN